MRNNKDNTISIRFTEDEKDFIYQKAEQEDISVSALLRKIIKEKFNYEQKQV